MSRKKTQLEYQNELEIKNPSVEIITKYIDAKTKVLHRCKKHGVEWLICPSDALRGQGCQLCRRGRILSMTTMSNDEYLKRVKEKNPNTIPIETYVDMKTPISHYHKDCGHVTRMIPTSVLRGAGCIQCKGIKIRKALVKSQEQFENELYEVNPNIIVESAYVRTIDNISCRCLVCGCTWTARANHLLEGHGCPNCATIRNSNSLRKSNEQFLRELKTLRTDVEPIEKYVSDHTKILCRCEICKHTWYVAPNKLLIGRKCPVCKETLGEKRIRQYLETHNIEYIKDKRFDDLRGVKGKKLSYDFHILEYNCLLEFQGEQHERSVEMFGGSKQFQIQKEHDKRKKDYAISNGYVFLEISYQDINQIDFILDECFKTLKSETVTTTGIAQ